MTASLMRSKLFVPGSRPALFAKALAGEADALSFDLEDAVEASRKGEARQALGAWLRTTPLDAAVKTIMVRVNGLATEHFAADLAAVAWPGLDLVNLPKAESVDDVRRAAAALARLERERGLPRPIGLLLSIESPGALRRAAEIAGADPRVAGLQLGLADLFGPLGIDRRDALAVRQVQLALRLAAGEAGVWVYDAAFAAVNDPAGFQQEAEAARRLGYLGKSCIHPSQVPLANAAFRPSDAEIAHARRVVEAFGAATAQGIGAILVDGQMIDAPFARRAEAIVEAARRLGLAGEEEDGR